MNETVINCGACRKKSAYEDLLKQAKGNLVGFRRKTSNLYGGYRRVLSKYRGKSSLSLDRFQFISQELKR